MTAEAKFNLPAGFRFHPTDEELVNHYLIKKCSQHPISVPIIAEIDLYKFNPWILPEMALYGEKEWYFFSPRDRKYPNGSRPNRTAGNGYWKATGADKPIGRPKTLAIKKALVFYAGKAPKGVKTNWIMHEYRLANVDRSAAGKKNNSKLDDWVLCRIYNKKGKLDKHSLDTEAMTMKYPKLEDEKPDIETLGMNMIESSPKLHPDTSSSGQVFSPDFAWENEVQSEVKWNDFGNEIDFGLNNYLEDGFSEIPYSHQLQFPGYQMSPLQDICMFMQ